MITTKHKVGKKKLIVVNETNKRWIKSRKDKSFIFIDNFCMYKFIIFI